MNGDNFIIGLLIISNVVQMYFADRAAKRYEARIESALDRSMSPDLTSYKRATTPPDIKRSPGDGAVTHSGPIDIAQADPEVVMAALAREAGEIEA